MANILITGASGFIGKHLLDKLSFDNHQIVVIKNKTDLVLPKEKRPANIQICTGHEIENINMDLDFIFHLATHYSKLNDHANVSLAIDSNLSFGHRILDLAVTKHARLIYTSSYMQYLGGPSDSAYVLSKKLFSLLAQAYSEKFNLLSTEIVIYDTFGVDDQRNKVFNSILEAMKSEKNFTPQNPEWVLNLSLVDDIAKILASQIDNSYKGIWQIKSKQDVSVGNLVEIMESLWNSHLPSDILTTASDPNNLQDVGISTIFTETNLIQGIKNVIERRP